MKFLDYWSYLLLSISKIFLFSILTASAFNFSFLLINLATILLMTSWALLLKAETRRWILMASLFLHSTLLISDLWYYRYFEDLLSIALLSDIGQMGDVGGGFMTLIQAKDFLFFADLLLFALVIRYMSKHPTSTVQRTRRIAAVAGFIVGLVLFAVPLTVSYANNEQWIADEPISNMREYYQLGFWGYHGIDAARGIGDALGIGGGITKKEETAIQELDEGVTEAAASGTNVIVLQLESFQTSVIGQKINGQELTPNLNRLRDEMLYFPNFYHQTHEGRTSDAEFVANASLHPVKSGSVYTQYADNEFDALPELLKEAGYDTAAMHAFEKDFWNRNDFYKKIGFSQFFSKEDFPDKENIGMALNDKDFFTTSVRLMEELDEPFYAFMVALTSHIPYEIPNDEKQLDLSGYRDPLLQGYYHTIHYVDAAVGLMVEQLKTTGMWNDSLIVFYGDHDSGLTAPQDEMAQKAGADSPVELFNLDRSVPLFIKPANLKRGRTVDASGGQIDIAPTVLQLLGIEPAFMLGEPLLDEDPNLTVFRDGSFRYENLYYAPDLTKSADNGTCYKISSGSEVPLSQCSGHISKAAEELRLSDTIIEEDALAEIRGK